MSKIVTSHIYPPIPIRCYDWTAYRDGTEDDKSSPLGFGETEREAIIDLLDQEDE